MNNAKKLASLLLVLALAFTLAVPALAEGDPASTNPTYNLDKMEGALEGGKITISNAIPGQTYHLYQILYLESYKISTANPTKPDGTDRIGTYAYKPNSQWEAFLKQARPADEDVSLKNYPADYIAIDPTTNYATWNGDALNNRAEALSRLAIEYANAEGSTIVPVATAVARELTDQEKADGKTNVSVTFENLKLGYYLVDSTVGTLCELYTTNAEITIEDKNIEPTNRRRSRKTAIMARSAILPLDFSRMVVRSTLAWISRVPSTPKRVRRTMSSMIKWERAWIL